jgi:hypothetical protein
MRLRLTPLLLAGAAALALASTAVADLKTPRVSPNATVTQTIGLTDFTVTYSRPGVKGRAIWGDLVPYDKPWRTGANDATRFTTSDSITFGGQKLPAGGYSLFTIPGKDEWTVALNSEKDLWGAYDYKPEKDVLRIKVKPTAAEHQEWMNFTFENLTPTSGELTLRWEKLEVAVPITVNVNDQVLAAARSEIDKPDWRTPYRAADFTLTNNVAVDEGEKWLQKSLSIQKNYYNLSLLARYHMKAGRKKEAVATAQQAIAAGKASKETVDTAATEKLLAEWTKS